MHHFMGYEYIWFFGIVENRLDPLKTGRVQVRKFGWDTPSNSLMPTSQLLWCHIEVPMHGNVNPPREGAMVKGYFMDGRSGQHPVICAVIPGIPETIGDPSHGFNDPRTNDQLQSAPLPIQNVQYKDDGSGAVIQNASTANRYPTILNEPTTSRIARNENVDKTVIGQINNNIQGSEQKLAYNAQYPYDNVHESESGHVIEIDDTPGAERLSWIHRTGTYEELRPDGSRSLKVLGTNYELVLKDNNLEVFGDCNITINGNANVTVKKDANLVVQQDCNLAVQNDCTVTVQKDCTLNVDGDYNVNIGGNYTLSAKNLQYNLAQYTATCQGAYTVNAHPINLNG